MGPSDVIKGGGWGRVQLTRVNRQSYEEPEAHSRGSYKYRWCRIRPSHINAVLVSRLRREPWKLRWWLFEKWSCLPFKPTDHVGVGGGGAAPAPARCQVRPASWSRPGLLRRSLVLSHPFLWVRTACLLMAEVWDFCLRVPVSCPANYQNIELFWSR